MSTSYYTIHLYKRRQIYDREVSRENWYCGRVFCVKLITLVRVLFFVSMSWVMEIFSPLNVNCISQ